MSSSNDIARIRNESDIIKNTTQVLPRYIEICPSKVHCDKLGADCIDCEFNSTCRYGANVTAVCHVKPQIICLVCAYLMTKLQNTHTHIRLTALCPGLPGWASTRKVKPIWILLKQETVSGNGISRAVCKSALRTRQITMPAPHYSVFYRPGALPAAQPTVSKHWRQRLNYRSKSENLSVSSYPYIVSYYMHLLRFFCVPAFCLPTWFLIVQCILNCNLANLCYGISIQWTRCECNMAASNNANDW